MFKSKFEKLLNTATNNFPLGPDWKSTMKICEIIRLKDVKPNFALNAIRKKLSSNIPHVALGSLLVMECCIINCGKLLYEEFATKPFMEQMRLVIKTTPYEIVKNKLLDLLQRLGFAFQIIPKYCAVQDAVDILKAEGYTFPTSNISYYPTYSSDVLVVPDYCYQCRVKFGIVKPLAVCGACFEMSRQPQTNKALTFQNKKTEEELREDEELQLALALSQSEMEQQQVSTELYSAPSVKEGNFDAESDPELARYLNRSYWEYRTEQKTKHVEINNTLTNMSETNNTQNLVINTNVINKQSEDTEEMETQLISVKSQLDIFVNRIKSNLSRGRTIINDEALEAFYSKITPSHQKLLQYIQQLDEKRLFFERLQDKMVQVKDTRAALDAVRDDHKAAFQKEAAFAKQQRQLQLAKKLDILRQRKQQYQQYHHQMTLQQVQQQEHEMAKRMEHQRQSYINNSGYDPSSLPSVPTAPTPYTTFYSNSLISSQMPENSLRYPQSVDSDHFQHITQFKDIVERYIPQNPSADTISQPVNVPSNEPDNLPRANPNNTQPIHQPQMTPMTYLINSEAPKKSSMSSTRQHSYSGVHPQKQPLIPDLQQPPISTTGPQPQDFVRIHMIPENPSTIPNIQTVILPSDEPINLAQANPYNTQSIHQPLMTPRTNLISSETSISASTRSMHQQSHPDIDLLKQPLIPDLQQPISTMNQQMSTMSQQNHILVGQSMMLGQNQQPMMDQRPTMTYGGHEHIKQYGNHQNNPQPSVADQTEQSKVEQPEIADLMNFD